MGNFFKTVLPCVLSGMACLPAIGWGEIQKSGLTQVVAESVELLPQDTTISRARRAAGSNVTGKVAVDDTFNRKFQSASAIGVVDGKWVRITGSFSGNTVTFPSVPAGVWDFYVFFNGSDGVLMLSQEDKKVPLESLLLFDEEDADIRVDFDFVLPDGSKPELSLLDSRDNHVVERGNIVYEGRSMHFTHKGMQLFTHNNVFTYRFVNSDGSLTQDHLANSFKTNGAVNADASSVRQYAWTGGAVHIQKGVPLVSSSLSNSASDYVMADVEFAGTAYNGPDSIPDHGMEIMSYDTFNGKAYLWNRTFVTTSLLKPEVYGKVYYSGPSAPDGTRYMRYPQPSRRVAKVTSGRLTVGYSVTAQPFRNTGGKVEFLGLHNSGGGIVGKWLKDEDGTVNLLKSNPWMAMSGEGRVTIGNSTATTVFTPMTQHGITPFEWGFVGIRGEKREVDELKQSFVLTLDGDTLAANKQQLTALFNSWTKTPPAKGTFRLMMRNDNILIDTITGSNVMELEYASMGDDSTPPVLQIMRPMDGEEVSDRLKNMENSSIDIVAGDYAFNFQGVQNPFYTDAGKVNVKIEYAPHGDDTFSELPVSELEERFFMPGWGHYYRASLASAERRSPDGWFDVRVTLADAAGNTHRQIFSPAFYVDPLSGVAGPEDDGGVAVNYKDGMLTVAGSERPEVKVFDMTGRLVKCAFGKSVDVSSVSSGIYVVTVADRGSVKVFKKLFM